MIVNLALTNADLYKGCKVETVAGRLNLVTPVEEAVNLIGENIAKMVAACGEHDEVTLTGPMAVYAYLVVFHAVVHAFHKVYYDDGKGTKVLVAAHG